MKFLLVAYVLSGGQVDAYTLDSGLTYEDCMISVMQPLQAYQITPTLVVGSDRADLVCVLDENSLKK